MKPVHENPGSKDMFLKKELLSNSKKRWDTKKQFVIVGIVALLVSVGLSGCTDNSEYVNPNIPSYLLYQNKNDTIPSELRLNETERYVNNEHIWDYGQIYGKREGSFIKEMVFYSNETGQKAEKIEYFHKSSGFWYYRYALVCGNKYWIMDANAANGPSMYGPFEK